MNDYQEINQEENDENKPNIQNISQLIEQSNCFIQSFQMRNQSNFDIILKMPEKIFIKNMDGGCCAVEVDIKNEKIKDLIKKYSSKINANEENISLVFAGKLLQSQLQNYLYELSIQPNSTLMSVMISKGERKNKMMIIKDVNKKEHEIEFNDDKTGNQLKQYIYKNLCQSLEPNLMSLQYAGVDIQNNKKISFYKLVQTTGVRKIYQNKQRLGKIDGIILAYEVDSLGFDQKQTYRMPCGHVFGTEGMTAFLRSLVDGNQFEINCPANKPNGKICEYKWDYQTCRKIGVFTAEQNKLFEEGLSKNWIKKNSIACPMCKIRLIKGQLKSNRVKCSNCKYGDYCYRCFQLWKSSGEHCGNQDCISQNYFLQKIKWDLPFKLSTNGKCQTYMLPKFRRCPKCHNLIQIVGGSKHIYCRCKMYFCWVCLAENINGPWPCGGAFDYCGKVAQTQQI